MSPPVRPGAHCMTSFSQPGLPGRAITVLAGWHSQQPTGSNPSALSTFRDLWPGLWEIAWCVRPRSLTPRASAPLRRDLRVANDLSSPVVLEAMARGFYPQGHWGSMKWWSPPERAIMDLASVHIAKRFRRTMRGSDMRIAFDTDFAGVIDGCAAPRDPSRPISPGSPQKPGPCICGFTPRATPIRWKFLTPKANSLAACSA